MKKIIKDTIALFIITLVAGLLLGFVYQITKDPIAAQNEKVKINAYNSVFSNLDTYEEIEDLTLIQEAVNDAGYTAVTIDEISIAYDQDMSVIGYIITDTDGEGYGGDIQMTVGIDTEGTITGLELLVINETAGLGMKAKESWFREQYVGINADQVVYSKTGATEENEIDAISSATITTNAVTNGVNGAIVGFKVLGGAD